MSPNRSYPSAERYKRPGQYAKQVPTTNPGAEDLRFDVASEARDVAARLDAYAEESGLAGEASRPPPLDLTLEDAFRISQRTGREYLNAEEEYILAAIRLLIERHLWSPRLFNDTTVQVAGSGDDGDFQSALQVINELGVTQRLPYGGTVAASWVWAATEQLREQATGRYRQSSELALSASIPLLRGAGLVAQEALIQAERDLIYRARAFERFRREYLVDLANDYFRLLELQSQIENQAVQLRNLRVLEESTAARVEAGRLRDFERLIAANQVRSAIANLASLREGYRLAADRYKVRLGLPITDGVEILPLTLDLPEPEMTPEEATERALAFRLDLQNQRDQIDDARRGVSNARNNLLPNLDFTGRVGLPTDPDAREGGVAFDPDETNYSAGLTFGLPLDREIERLQLRQSVITLEQQIRVYEQFRDNVVLSVRAAVRAVDLARFQLNLAEEQVLINERRLEGIRLDEAAVSPQEVVDAEFELLSARNSRDRALTDLRNAVLDYLLQSDQLRVARDGTFLPLPGMEEEGALAEEPVAPGQ